MVYRNNRSFNLGPIEFLIALNLILFVATFINPSRLIDLLGLTPAYLAARPWTIVTNLFIHGGMGHIFTNMLTLYFFGSYLIRLVGERNFFLVYFGGGLLGNIFYIMLGPSFITAIGASGAVFALGGALTVITPKLKVIVFPIPAPIPLWAAVIGGFLILSFFPFVAWQAHLGGLVFGLATASLFFRGRTPRFY